MRKAPPDAERCIATRAPLADGSLARCMLKATHGPLCWRHIHAQPRRPKIDSASERRADQAAEQKGGQQYGPQADKGASHV